MMTTVRPKAPLGVVASRAELAPLGARDADLEVRRLLGGAHRTVTRLRRQGLVQPLDGQLE